MDIFVTSEMTGELERKELNFCPPIRPTLGDSGFGDGSDRHAVLSGAL
jgi:hypothetical protein